MPAKKKKVVAVQHSTRRPAILNEEWDFSTCPPDQVHFCRRYEFARHNEGLKADIADRRSRDDWNTGLAPHDWEFYTTYAKLSFFRSFSEFPAVPWLKIPAKKRAAGCEEYRRLEGPFYEVAPERLDLEAGYPNFPNDVGMDALHRVSVIEIDLSASRDAIKQSFAGWLDSIHRESDIVKEDRGGVTDADLLKALGAYRLLLYFDNDWTKAAIWSANHRTGGKPLYGEQPEWIKARRKAEKFISSGVPQSDLAGLVSKLGLSKLPADERAKVKVHIMMHVDRAAARRLKKLGPEQALAELRSAAGLAHKTSG